MSASGGRISCQKSTALTKGRLGEQLGGEMIAAVHALEHDACSWGVGSLHRGSCCQSQILKGESDSPIEKRKKVQGEQHVPDEE